MTDTPPTASSKLTVSVTYNIADKLGNAPLVPVEVIGGIRGCRSGYSFIARPVERNGSVVEGLRDDESDVTMMWLWKLKVTCHRQGLRRDLDPDEAVEIAGFIARDIKTALALRNPKLGFPGETPRRERVVATIDGQQVKLDSNRHSDANSVTTIPAPGNEVTLTELEAAASGDSVPSRARMMVTEAGFQAFWNSRASHVTAVVVAASACEVAIHSCIRHLGNKQIQPLLKKVLPKNEQAKLSPAELVDGVIPLLTDRRLADELPDLWGSIRGLFRARNTAVHQGVLPEGTDAPLLVQRARVFVRWIEELDVELRDD